MKQLETISASKSNMSASEWTALLESCPEWVMKRDVQKAAMLEKEERYLREEAPLRTDLHALGYPIKWVWDFVNSSNRYLDAIPVLLDHFERPYSEDVREGIVRALAVPEARGIAGGVIAKALKEEGLSDKLRWAMANTLATVADKSNQGELRELYRLETNRDVADRLARAIKKANKN